MNYGERDIKILRPLVDKILELSSDLKQEQKKKSWAEH